MGFVPCTDYLKSRLPEAIGKGGFVRCNDSLQLKAYPHIFAVGDILPHDTEKLGQNAELHAEVVVSNLARFDQGKSLKQYRPSKKFMLISMGPKHCILINGGTVLTEGITTRMLKNLVEFKVMRDFK